MKPFVVSLRELYYPCTFKDIFLWLRDRCSSVLGKLESGREAAVHGMQKLFSSPEVEAVLLVDATNAFNSINRQTALRNIQHICPVISTILINPYRDDVNLFIDGERLLSQEGTTQGDPLAMATKGAWHWRFYH